MKGPIFFIAHSGTYFVAFFTVTKIKGVIFDIDGTLADTVPLVVSCFHRALGPYLRHPISDQQIMDTFGPTEEAAIRTFAPAHVEEGLNKFHTYYRKLHPQ